MDLESQISPFIRHSFPKLGVPSGALILDAPCGFGRHSYWLASLGYDVHAIDIDQKRLRTAAENRPALAGHIDWRLGNLEEPLQPELCYDVFVVVHYYSPNIVSRACESLKVNGWLLFETFGGQGRNYLNLPRAGELDKLLMDRFDLRSLTERPVGPRKEAVSLTAIARKLR